MNFYKHIRATTIYAGASLLGMLAYGPAMTEEDDSPSPEVMIVHGMSGAQEMTGSAHYISSEELLKFNYADTQDIVRQVPGVSVQLEDGYGLRPNISIRGVATERSSRITLLEDNVLVAPAPYSAPAAYYFPTAGRMHAIEVLKGPAAITQGPYTIGGAFNMISTPIPQDMKSQIMTEIGGDSDYRMHGYAGGTSDSGVGFLVETHQWGSDGFQNVDNNTTNTGLSLQDYMLKMSYAPSNSRHSVDLKFHVADQGSNQSYMGLTETDFRADPYRRYGLSALDGIRTQHDQQILTYRFQTSDTASLSVTVYNNEHYRNWYKTEGLDITGTTNADTFKKQSWGGVIDKINRGKDICEGDVCLTPEQAKEILDGTRDTEAGGIQLKANEREYFSRGVQAVFDWDLETGPASHELQFGVRYHEDEEDRIQRLDAYTQINGRLVLEDQGTTGHSAANNRLQEAEAIAIYLYDRIEWGDWVVTPGVRYEDIDQKRSRFCANPVSVDPTEKSKCTDAQPMSDRGVYRDGRENKTEVWLPGFGMMYQASDSLSLLAGYHKGFSAPSNAPGVDEEKADNYEFGFRYANHQLQGEIIGFYSDYKNLIGECTASSGASCTVGDAFNGDAATVQGLEALITTDFAVSESLLMPLSITYTYMDTEFDTDFESDFFGTVSKGDAIPYIPEHQLRLGLGLEASDWTLNVSGNYVDETCVKSPCDNFNKTESSFTIDVSASYRIGSNITLIARVSNLTDQEDIVARQPYGARPNKERTAMIGLRMENSF